MSGHFVVTLGEETAIFDSYHGLELYVCVCKLPSTYTTGHPYDYTRKWSWKKENCILVLQGDLKMKHGVINEKKTETLEELMQHACVINMSTHNDHVILHDG